jgi:hypothetical protein
MIDQANGRMELFGEIPTKQEGGRYDRFQFS